MLPAPPKGKDGWPWTVETPLQADIGEKIDRFPKISVVTPSYNQGAFIEETIRSVLLQGYPNLEYIIIDGGSSDNSIEIIKKYEPFIAYWISEKDRGQSHAINKGTNIASGEVSGWLNSDDILLPGALIAMGKAFSEDPEADLIYGGGGKIDINGRELKTIGFRPFDRKRIRRVFYILQPSMMYKRDTFLMLGGLDESLHFVMDWELLQRFEPFAKIVSIPDPIGMYRKYENTKTGSKNWAAAKEVGDIGKKYHGKWDVNYLIYKLKTNIGRFRRPFAKKIIRPIIDYLIVRLTSRYGSLIGRRWPRDHEV